MSSRERRYRHLPAVITVTVLVSAWQVGVALTHPDPLILPSPSAIVSALWSDRALLGSDCLVTGYEVVLGVLCAIAIGVGLALAMHSARSLRQMLHPLVVGMQAVPIVVIAPLLVLVLGFGLLPKLLMVAVVSFFPVTINLYDGLRNANSDSQKLLRSFGATRWQTLRLLEIPSALPATFTGLKVTAAVAVIGAVFAEWAGSEAGLGHTLLIASGQLETARAFAATLLLFIMAIVLYGLFALLEARLVDWTTRNEHDS